MCPLLCKLAAFPLPCQPGCVPAPRWLPCSGRCGRCRSLTSWRWRGEGPTAAASATCRSRVGAVNSCCAWALTVHGRSLCMGAGCPAGPGGPWSCYVGWPPLEAHGPEAGGAAPAMHACSLMSGFRLDSLAPWGSCPQAAWPGRQRCARCQCLSSRWRGAALAHRAPAGPSCCRSLGPIMLPLLAHHAPAGGMDMALALRAMPMLCAAMPMRPPSKADCAIL